MAHLEARSQHFFILVSKSLAQDAWEVEGECNFLGSSVPSSSQQQRATLSGIAAVSGQQVALPAARRWARQAPQGVWTGRQQCLLLLRSNSDPPFWFDLVHLNTQRLNTATSLLKMQICGADVLAYQGEG